MTHNDMVQELWDLCDVARRRHQLQRLRHRTGAAAVHQNGSRKHRKRHPAKAHIARRLPLAGHQQQSKGGQNLLDSYKRILLALSSGQDDQGNTLHEDPLITAIYADAQTRLREPRHLKQLVTALDGIDWFSAQKDGLGDLYEGLLEKNANETKSGAGQYFTPRALINSMVRCIQPQPGEVVQDPAAGTAGFLKK